MRIRRQSIKIDVHLSTKSIDLTLSILITVYYTIEEVSQIAYVCTKYIVLRGYRHLRYYIVAINRLIKYTKSQVWMDIPIQNILIS